MVKKFPIISQKRSSVNSAKIKRLKNTFKLLNQRKKIIRLRNLRKIEIILVLPPTGQQYIK
jgi:hypothetical protein